MLDVLYGFASSIILLYLYSFFEKRRVQKIGRYVSLSFIFLLMIAAMIVEPTNNVVEWMIWLLFFYTVLDDMKTKTVFAPIFFLIIVLLFLQGQTIEEMIFAVIVLLFSLLFVRKTKETFLSLGDAYGIFALAFWLDGYILFSIVLSFFMAAAVLPIMSYFYKAKYYAFMPFLVLASIVVKEGFYIEWFFVITMAINFLVLIRLKMIRKKNK